MPFFSGFRRFGMRLDERLAAALDRVPNRLALVALAALIAVTAYRARSWAIEAYAPGVLIGMSIAVALCAVTLWLALRDFDRRHLNRVTPDEDRAP